MDAVRTPLVLLLFLSAFATAAAGQSTSERARRPAAPVPPSPAEVLGYDLGERLTDHGGVMRYLEALAGASPRVRIERYGETVEGRPLVQVVIAREDNLVRLEEVLARARELAHPGTALDRARAIAASNPAVVYFGYGVHGSESSSTEAALWTAWDLARDAADVRGVLDSVVVVIDPSANPDGRDRYVHWYWQAQGARPNPSPNAREHWEPWPGGRYNHYLFDLNRDWAWVTQPETRARLATWTRWTPQVHVDFHEMAWTSSYFFFPATEPINPIYPPHILEWGRYFGQANAAAFDQQGALYYTGEGFDLFYPGYGDTWPSLVGAVGMTYEQAGGSRAGVVVRRPDGAVLTLAERAGNHRLAAAATLRAVAARKSQLLLDFAAFHRTVGEGMPDILLVPGDDPDRLRSLVRLLRDQEIVVEYAAEPFRATTSPHTGFAARREFPAGTVRVPARQSRGRLALTLLQPETVLDGSTSEEVTAWSLPYAYGVEAHSTTAPVDASWVTVDGFELPPPAPATTAARTAETANGAQPYGFLLPPSLAIWPGLLRFVSEGGRAIMLEREFTIDGRAWPAGAVFLPRGGAADLAGRIARAGLGGLAVPVSTGLATQGRDLGTGRALPILTPRVAVLAGEGISATSFGAHWFFLEQTLGLGFDAVPLARLGDLRLTDYNVIVLPEMDADVLDDRITEALLDWVSRGGTLIAVGRGARVVGPTIAGVSLREPEPDPAEYLTSYALRGRETREQDHWDDEVAGTILPVRVDPDHPLGFGTRHAENTDQFFVLHRGGIAFEPDNEVETVAYFPDPLDKVSGIISRRNLDALAHGAWLVTRSVERGRVILFADDPVFRHFWYGTFLPYVHALVLGPRL